MARMITAIFEDGIFKPLQAPDLTRRQVVSLLILMPRRQERAGTLPGEAKETQSFLVSWKDWFATKLMRQKKGPLDLTEVSVDALWL